MSEKFNPLAEAQANASEDRRRFYDWVGDSADHEDNEGFRAANEDMADYLGSRKYEDDNGNFHDAKSGKFIGNPNEEEQAKKSKIISEEDAYYNRLQSESETEGPFAGKGLKDIAEMVREARAAGDKTMELDARAAFDDKFMEAAEKYDWQGVVENADGTTTDRNAIADQKLAYYEAIMDNATDEQPEASTDEPEENTPAPSEETPFTEEDQAKLNEKLANDESQEGESQEEYVPKHRAEFSDEDTPIFDEVSAELGGADSEAKEGESQEEYEARQPGRHRGEPLKVDDLDAIAAGENPGEASGEPLKVDDLDKIAKEGDKTDSEEETTPRSRRQKIADAIKHPGAAAGAYMGSRTAEKAGEDNEKEGKRKWLKRLLGGAALVGAGVAAGYLMFKGHDASGLQDQLNNAQDRVSDLQDTVTNQQTRIDNLQDQLHDTQQATGGWDGSGGSETAGSWSFADGSGGEALLSNNGIDAAVWYEHQDEFLKQFPDLAYRMSDGNVGLVDQGSGSTSQLPEAAQAFWEQFKR